MIKKNWKLAFSLSVIIHLLLVTAVGYSALAWNMQEENHRQEQPQQPIEVELGKTPIMTTRSDVLQQTPTPKNDENAQKFFTEKNQHPNPAHSVIPNDAMPSTLSTGNIATSIPQTGGVTTESNSVANGNDIPSDTKVNESTVAKTITTGKTAKVAVIEGPSPDYPTEARSEGWEGTVRVRVLVSEQGTVNEASIVASSGHSSIDAAALKGLRRWRFSPAYKDGQAISAWVVVPVVFELQ